MARLQRRHGAKGRLYDWTRLQLARPDIAGIARWLLVRCRIDGELALNAVQRSVYYATLLSAAVALVLLLAPGPRQSRDSSPFVR